MVGIVKAIVDVVNPPSLPELRQRLETARQALVASQAADDEASASLDVAYARDDEAAALKAQADKAQTRLAFDRAAGRVAAIERQVVEAELAEADQALDVQRKALKVLVTTRNAGGPAIADALDKLAALIKAVEAADAAIVALPVSVRGNDAVPGHNLGGAALRMHLASELAQRGILGEPTSIAPPSVAEWLAVGSRTLLASID